MDTMPLKIETIQTRAAVTPQTFRVEPHPANSRLRHIVLDGNVLRFFADGAAKKWPLRGSLKGTAAFL